ncbi:MAG: hypothetical protein V4694_05385 [Pseudomonadota bacterium]
MSKETTPATTKATEKETNESPWFYADLDSGGTPSIEVHQTNNPLETPNKNTLYCGPLNPVVVLQKNAKNNVTGVDLSSDLEAESVDVLEAEPEQKPSTSLCAKICNMFFGQNSKGKNI